ncbi:MAG TPA: ABC transporter permease [Vicinamibacterales bacterium]|nr:ABC transporter permease [Vicinamibacterales bacterium]
MFSDLRVSLRLLWKDKAFTITAAVTLAVCIGANAALFSVVRGVLLKPLAMPDADRVVLAGNAYPGAGVDQPIGAAVPDYFDRLRDITAFSDQALIKQDRRSIEQAGGAASVEGMVVTPSFFRVAAVKPQLGRTFTDDEGEIGHELETVLSDAYWRSQFGGDRSVVGRQLRIDGRPHTIVGVMPPRFRPTDADIALWTPMAFTAKEKSDDQRHSNNVINIARLKPGATVQQAQAQIDKLNAANLERFPQLKEVLINAGFHTIVTRLQDQMVKEVRPVLYLMWGGSLCVLLIGWVNVANLVLVRSRVRLKELATRMAIGAGTWRIARQLAVEHVLLSFGAALAGIAIGFMALRAMNTINLQDLPRAQDISLDTVVVSDTLIAAAAIGLVLGLIPIVATLRANAVTVLREEGRSATSGRGAQLLRRVLVVAQVGSAFVLLIGAGLLFATFRKVLAVNPGFTTTGVLTAAVSLPNARYGDDDARRRFTDEALRRVRTLPGVTMAGATDSIPLGNNGSASAILAEGYTIRKGESLVAPSEVRISPGYFEAIGAKLRAGRFFTEHDAGGSLRVIMVDDRLARRFWPNQNPIGRRMYRPTDGASDLTAVTEKTQFMTVVGVIAEMKLRNLTDGDRLVGAYFLPLSQEPQGGLTFVLKTKSDPALLSGTVRREVAAIDGQLPVFEIQPMTHWTERSVATRRAPALLSIVFGFVALFLAAIGIYGMLAYLVTQRRKEIGIRVALGSSAGGVFHLVLREGLVLVAIGLLVGGVGSAFLRTTLESQLFGVSASDPLVLLLVSALLLVIAFIACAVPARRATKIDPLLALAE